MKTLNIDIETYSSLDLAKSGVYRYAEAHDFDILLFAYSVDAGPVHVVDLAKGESIPGDVLKAITDEGVTKWAFNAQFERTCLSRFLNAPLNPRSWRCSMVWAAYLGLPLSLEGAAIVTGADKKKLQEGKDLIRYFCKPCKPTQVNGGRERNYPHHDPEKWDAFKRYNQRDVETEMAIQKKIGRYPVPKDEWGHYVLDQTINDRGILLDPVFVEAAIACDTSTREALMNRLRTLTKLENPNSVMQMRDWLLEQGVETDALDKAAVHELLKSAQGDVAEVLTIRQKLAKSSVKKYTAMKQVAGKDDRARGLIQFYGANRSGRYAGRLIQVQNLPQNHVPDLEEARDLVRTENLEALDMLYPSVPDLLSELIRTAFVPKKDHQFIVADFSAIEARVIAWLAGETWRNEVFATHGKIYEASASQMFNVPIDEIQKGSPLRQKGKISELALGYGGSVGALKAMGALDMGVKEEELQPLVQAWRQANPKIVQFWWAVDQAAQKAVRKRTTTATHGISFTYQSGMLFVRLPSGRHLSYVKPAIVLNDFGREGLCFEGIGATKKWERIDTYGPKLVENIVQAVSRDLLTHAMQRIEQEGYAIVMHVHDEVVVEAKQDVTVEKICALMTDQPEWSKGLNVKADGYACSFYQKD